jgi:enoyl-CoA hydratase
MKEETPFKVEKKEHIAWVTLNRPEKRNTMDYAFFEGIEKIFKELAADLDVRVIVMNAEGKSFTAGLDLVAMGSMLKGEGVNFREGLRQEIMQFQGCLNAIERCPKPVIAAVHGHCIGGGIDLLCVCDIRIASRDAVFSVRETRVAIVADLGTLQRLPSIIGQGWFRELALTGRDFTAEEAIRMGLITKIADSRDDLLEQAARLAEEIAALPPLTVQGVKDVINYSRDNGIQAGLNYVAQKNAAMLPSKDLMEAFTAFMEKRKPVYTGE